MTLRKGSEDTYVSNPDLHVLVEMRRQRCLLGLRCSLIIVGGGLLLPWLGGLETSVLCDSLPGFEFAEETLALLFELIVGSAQLRYGLLRKQLLKRPLLDVLLFVLLELSDEVTRALEDGALVLFAAGHYLGQLVNPLVDGFTAPTFH